MFVIITLQLSLLLIIYTGYLVCICTFLISNTTQVLLKELIATQDFKILSERDCSFFMKKINLLYKFFM